MNSTNRIVGSGHQSIVVRNPDALTLPLKRIPRLTALTVRYRFNRASAFFFFSPDAILNHLAIGPFEIVKLGEEIPQSKGRPH
jgi:hypothetical protein